MQLAITERSCFRCNMYGTRAGLTPVHEKVSSMRSFQVRDSVFELTVCLGSSSGAVTVALGGLNASRTLPGKDGMMIPGYGGTDDLIRARPKL